MKEINLTNSELKVQIDDEDYEWLSQFKWRLHDRGYAVRSSIKSDNCKKNKKFYMHKEIMKLECEIDHKNLNKLDNRKENLRVCTRGQNNSNKNKNVNKQFTSKYKGVSLHKKSGKWVVFVKHNRRNKNFGYFHSEVAAALKYNEVAIKYFGEFAKLNEIDPADLEKYLNESK